MQWNTFSEKNVTPQFKFQNCCVHHENSSKEVAMIVSNPLKLFSNCHEIISE